MAEAPEHDPSALAPGHDPARSRLLASLFYETILLAGVLFLASALFTGLIHGTVSGWSRVMLQLWLATVAGIYFCGQWSRTGQTLPMKTWRLRLVDYRGRPASLLRCTARYVGALAGAIACGIGFLWIFFDRDRRYLHDRMAGTRIIRID